ncbi:MAG: cupin domain-containing protein [Chloroflexi bacterium OHK40]
MEKGAAERWVPLFPGVRRRRLVSTAQIYQMEVLLEPGSEVPLHQHPQEQISYVARGRLRFQVGDSVIEAGAGSSVAIPGGTLHAVWTLEESLAIDTFTPPRDDYLAADGD